MPTKIFVNLPVKDLNRSRDFFRQLGFNFNTHFTNNQGWMYGHGFQDLDGHLWETIYMDPNAIKQTDG